MKKRIQTKGNKFIDCFGRQIILHGINMVCKEREKNYIGDYTKEDFALLRQWGFNVIRLGIFWDAIEPEPGSYDDSYLTKLDQWIDYAKENDMAVYLDMHQDLFSYKYSDGAPEWATLTDGLEHVETELWSESYLLSPAVQHCFDQFWSDAKASDGVGIQEHFIKMWQHIAKRYASNDNVIGYDFFNEPFPGTAVNEIMMDLLKAIGSQMNETEAVDEETLMGMWLDPEQKLTLLNRFNDRFVYESIITAIASIPQQFDQTALSSFYQRIGTAVREMDPSTLFFLEANYFSNAGVESKISPIHNADGTLDAHQVYSPHGYDLMVDTQMYDQSSFERLDVIFDTHKKVQKRLQLPMLIGEWGCFPNAGEPEIKQAQYLMRLFTANQLSDTYFDFSHIKNNRITDAIVRPYLMKAAGEIISSEYNDDTQEFHCEINGVECDGCSVIYVPDLSTVNNLSITPANTVFKKKYLAKNNQELPMKNAGYLIIDCADNLTQTISFTLGLSR